MLYGQMKSRKNGRKVTTHAHCCKKCQKYRVSSKNVPWTFGNTTWGYFFMRQPVHCNCLNDYNCEMRVWWNWGLCTQSAICPFKTNETNHTLCVRIWGLGVETGTQSYKLLWCNLCIINLRTQSSLQMPNHTISYAFCICTCIVYETPDSAKSSDSYTVLYAICMYSVHTCMNLWTQFQSSDSYTKVCLIQMHIKTLAIHLPLMPQYQLVQVTQWRHRQVACHL